MSTSTRITVAEYDEMIARGDFEPSEDHRVELIEGELVSMYPTGEPHEEAVDILNEWSFRAGPIDQIRVRSQQSVGLPELASVPQPDLAWVRRRSYATLRPQPEDVLLVVEVADSSLAKDRGVKSRLYARSGVADYWIVNIKDRSIEVRRDPEGDTYRSRTTYRPGQSIAPLAFPEVALPVGLLFPDDDDPA